MIKGGKGGSKTAAAGLDFERRINLRTAFNKLPNYHVQDNDILFKGEVVAKIYKKHELYDKLLKDLNIDWKSLISQKLLPDETIFVISANTLFIVEMKFQNVSGSVDEKLQTCDFKKKQYEKLFSRTNIKVEYLYILNDWFKQSRYRDVLNYIESVKCKFFFETLPLKVVGLPEH